MVELADQRGEATRTHQAGVLAHRVSVSFAVALTRDMPTIYGRLQEGFLEEHPGVRHACKTVTTDHSVTQKLDLSCQVGDLAGDQLGPVHSGLHPWLGSQ